MGKCQSGSRNSKSQAISRKEDTDEVREATEGSEPGCDPDVCLLGIHGKEPEPVRT